MPNRIIPITADYRVGTSTLAVPANVSQDVQSAVVLDRLQRPLRDLRISVTDRCNFRCVYCMPRSVFDKDYKFLPHSALLTFEEITRVARVLVAQGVTKIRLTGGEPLLRKNLDQLVAMLRAIEPPNGERLDLTLTTNGALLAQQAKALKLAGLDRVTVSLDALDESIFKAMNDAEFAVADVLRGLEAADRAGLGPIKVNMVVKADMNRDQVVPMARHFKQTPFVLRFIEYMDVGSSNGWQMTHVVPSAQIIAMLSDAPGLQLQPIAQHYSAETAQRWRYADGSNEIGVISSVTGAFCHDCTRLRLSTDGRLYTCLFASAGHDIRDLVRLQADDLQLAATCASIWRQRGDRYSELRSEQSPVPAKVEMSYIGG